MARGTHKVHPVGFRLGINKNWKSRWYAPKANYANLFLDDKKARDLINKKLKSAGVASVIIKRLVKKILIEISVARPGVVIGRGGKSITELKEELEKLLKQDVEIKVFEVKQPEIVAKLVAEAVAEQCEKRISPKIASARAVEEAEKSGKIEGIAVWVSGRIGGAEMARTVKAEWGTIPRHTLRMDIDYALAEAAVPGYGRHGVKVWINKGEKNTYSIN